MHRDNRTTANSIATINSVAAGDIGSTINATSETGSVYDAATGQVCDLRYNHAIFQSIELLRLVYYH